jgi:PAS domain S-box-containing protein
MDGSNVSRERILLVEDEPSVAVYTESSLKTLGYLVTFRTDSGELAVGEAEKIRPDLVLMDIELKGTMDGIEAARRIYHDLNIPVVFVTAFEDEQTFLRAKAVGPFGFVLKPFNSLELRNVLEIALHQHRASQRRTDEAHREADMKYRSLFREALVGMFQAGPTGEFLHVTTDLLKVLGCASYEELVAKSRKVNDILRFEPCQKGLEQLLANTDFPRSFELQAYRNDGSTVWVSGNARIVRGKDGRPLYYEGSVIDVTEQKCSVNAAGESRQTRK